MRILTGPKLYFHSLLFSPDRLHLAGFGESPSGGNPAWVWAVYGNGSPAYELPGDSSHFPRITSIAFGANGRTALVCQDDRHWRSFDLSNGQHVPEEQLSGWQARMVSGNGRWAVWSLYPGVENIEVRIRAAEFDGERWSLTWHRDIADPRAARARDEDHEFTGFRLSKDGIRLLAHFRTERVGNAVELLFKVIDTATGNDVSEWRGRLPSWVTPKGISPNGQVLCFDHNSFHVIDTTQPDSKTQTKSSSTQMPFTDGSFSPDGKLLATTCADTTVTMWDTTTWEPVQRFGWKIGRLRAVAFAPDGLTCAAGSDTGKVVLFDVDG